MVFIKDIDDYNAYDKLTPRTKHQRSPVMFKCSKCGKIGKKHFWRLKIPFLCADCQFEQTNIEKYGVKYPYKLKEFQDKQKETMIMKYGADNSSKVPQLREKIKNTMLEKYGCENPGQSEIVKEKMRNTSFEHYGTYNPVQNKEIYKKIRNTMNERYGVNVPIQNKEIHKKIKTTNIKKYGCDAAIKSDVVKRKIKNTMLKKYGVEYALQNHELFCKARKKYKFDGRTFDSKPEIEFYKKLKENFIDFEYQPDISFTYEYNGEVHNYHPDFKVGNVIYELKGRHFFDENEKMINPWDEKQNEICEAKHQCMIKNGIKIIKV